jgi:hypothetical protein
MVFAQVTKDTVTQSKLAAIDVLAESTTRPHKMQAVQMIETEVNAGNMSPELITILSELSTEGLHNSRETGFPDVRAYANEVLGKVSAHQAHLALFRAIQMEKDGVPLTKAFIALQSANDEIDGTAERIVDAVARFQRMNNYDDMSTYAAISTLIDLKPSATKKIMEMLRDINNANQYSTPVREYALEAIEKLSGEVAYM